MRLFDVLTIKDGVVYTVPVKDVTREKADYWCESLRKRSSGHLRVVIGKAGEYVPGDLYVETVDEEE